jgi:hypothetical protein
VVVSSSWISTSPGREGRGFCEVYTENFSVIISGDLGDFQYILIVPTILYIFQQSRVEIMRAGRIGGVEGIGGSGFQKVGDGTPKFSFF